MSPSAPDSHSNLSRQAIQGTLWMYLSFVAGKALTFLTTLVLARLLAPAEFGVMGYCLIAIQYLDILNTFGVGVALISRRDKIEEAANAAFVISQGMGILLFGVAWVAAPFIAQFFREESVTQLFRVLALSLPLGAFGAVPGALIQRSLRFKAKMIPDIGRSIIRGAVSLLLAWQGFGVWSLIWGDLAGDLLGVIALGLLTRWRPTFVFDRRTTREVLSFGGHITFVGLLGSLLVNVDYLLVGRILGATALGYYTLAYRIPELIIRNTIFVVDKVAHPLLVQLQSDAQKLRSIYFVYVRYVALFTFPTGVGLALIASQFVKTFYPAIWEPAIFPMQCIPLAIAIASIGSVPGVIYKVMNQPDVLSRLAVIKLPFTIAILWVGARWGINGVAIAQIVLSAFLVTLDVLVVNWIAKFHLKETLRAIAPAITASLAMSLAVAATATWLPPSGLISLSLLAVVGVAAYIGALTFVSRDTVKQTRTILRAAFSRS